MLTEIKSHYSNITTFVSRTSHKLRANGRHVDPQHALHEIMAWLARAQDATPDGGVAQAYFIKRQSWTASYPETTGYIIPTFFDYARFADDSNFADRALRMVDWEVNIQLPCGGIQASTIDAPKIVPTIFNTGMVIFGWIRAYEETKQKKYLNAATRAADWLVKVQDEDGAWRKFGSTVTTSAVNTYNTRVAWALLEVHRTTGNSIYRDAAAKNLDWALTQQLPNGWLQNNCLLDNERPYTHTIAYAMRGFLESYHLLADSPFDRDVPRARDVSYHKQLTDCSIVRQANSPLEGGQGGVKDSNTSTKPVDCTQDDVSQKKTNERYLQAAQAIFAGLRPLIKGDGFLAARFDKNWHPVASYCCITGNAQLAITAFRLSELTGDNRLIDEAKRLIGFVLQSINYTSSNRNIRGGVAGSFPITGKYHPNQYPNWAAKFTADAIMKCLEFEGKENA